MYVLHLEDTAVVFQVHGQSLQNVIISDSTIATKIDLWNNDIGKLNVGSSYHFKQVIVSPIKMKNVFSSQSMERLLKSFLILELCQLMM